MFENSSVKFRLGYLLRTVIAPVVMNDWRRSEVAVLRGRAISRAHLDWMEISRVYYIQRCCVVDLLSLCSRFCFVPCSAESRAPAIDFNGKEQRPTPLVGLIVRLHKEHQPFRVDKRKINASTTRGAGLLYEVFSLLRRSLLLLRAPLDARQVFIGDFIGTQSLKV